MIVPQEPSSEFRKTVLKSSWQVFSDSQFIEAIPLSVNLTSNTSNLWIKQGYQELAISGVASMDSKK